MNKIYTLIIYHLLSNFNSQLYTYHFQIGINIASWLKQIPVQDLEKGDDPDLYLGTFCYMVL